MAGGERPAESESTDAESYEFMAGEVTALADERAHHRFGITIGPRPGVVAIHLRRYRLVGLAPQRPALAGFFGAWARASASPKIPATVSAISAMLFDPSTGTI